MTNSPIHQFTNSPIHQFTNSFTLKQVYQFVLGFIVIKEWMTVEFTKSLSSSSSVEISL